VGLEDVDDLWADLDGALGARAETATTGVGVDAERPVAGLGATRVPSPAAQA
jgi:methionine-gamma-lyase